MAGHLRHLALDFPDQYPIGLLGIFYARKYMPDFTTPKRRFDFLGFMLFGLSLVLISTGLELFDELVLASYVSLGILLSGFCDAVRLHRARPPSPSAADRSRPVQNPYLLGRYRWQRRLQAGHRLRAILMPLMLQVGFGYPAIVAGCMMAPTAIGSLMAKSTVTQVLRWFGYRKRWSALPLSSEC